MDQAGLALSPLHPASDDADLSSWFQVEVDDDDVETITETDLGRLDQIRWCPVQFQAFVPGTDIRVHTVGERTFATAISTAATDYRYVTQQVDEAADLRAVDLEADSAGRCVALATELGLPLAGIDLKRTEQVEIFSNRGSLRLPAEARAYGGLLLRA